MNASPSDSRRGKEIRFTRNAQAAHFFIAALFFLCVGTGLYIASWDFLYDSKEPLLQRSWYGLLTVPFIGISIAVGIHLAKHAYVIFSPVGIELFPFFFPGKNMQVLYWSEVRHVELSPDQRMMEVTLSSPDERKVFVATAPLDIPSRILLARTITRIREQRTKGQPMFASEDE